MSVIGLLLIARLLCANTCSPSAILICVPGYPRLGADCTNSNSRIGPTWDNPKIAHDLPIKMT